MRGIRLDGGAHTVARLGVWCAAAGALAVLVGAVLPPIVEAASGRPAAWMRLLYAPVCHQVPERCLTIAGSALAVCARCTGLYLGGTLGLAAAAALVVGRARAVRRPWLVLLVLPTLADGLLAVVGLSPLAEVARLIVAVPAGFAAGLLLAEGVFDLVLLVSGDGARSGRVRGHRPVEESR
jgi:uncharacterized membrane protein